MLSWNIPNRSVRAWQPKLRVNHKLKFCPWTVCLSIYEDRTAARLGAEVVSMVTAEPRSDLIVGKKNNEEKLQRGAAQLPSNTARWQDCSISPKSSLHLFFISLFQSPSFQHFLPHSAVSLTLSLFLFSSLGSLSLSISLSSSRHVFCFTASRFFSHLKLFLSVSCVQLSCSFIDKRLNSSRSETLFQTSRS